jgi:hypothetical protein
MYERETVPCETCGKPTPYTGTKRCDACWQVERLLPAYLLAPKAWEFIRQHLAVLDDWKDGVPDGWDYEAVLRDNDVKVEWSHQLTSDGVTFSEAPPDLCGWGFYWVHGAIHIGATTEMIARKAAALFVSLWQRRVSASFCDKLMDGFIVFLERQEGTRLSFLVEIDTGMEESYLRLTREGLFDREPFTFDMEERLIAALDPQPDDEIIVTFTKRKKCANVTR